MLVFIQFTKNGIYIIELQNYVSWPSLTRLALGSVLGDGTLHLGILI